MRACVLLAALGFWVAVGPWRIGTARFSSREDSMRVAVLEFFVAWHWQLSYQEAVVVIPLNAWWSLWPDPELLMYNCERQQKRGSLGKWGRQGGSHSFLCFEEIKQRTQSSGSQPMRRDPTSGL